MSDPSIPLAERALRFTAGTFQDMMHTRDAASCALQAGAARATAATSQHPLWCVARAAWWAAVADRCPAPGISEAEHARS